MTVFSTMLNTFFKARNRETRDCLAFGCLTEQLWYVPQGDPFYQYFNYIIHNNGESNLFSPTYTRTTQDFSLVKKVSQNREHGRRLIFNCFAGPSTTLWASCCSSRSWPWCCRSSWASSPSRGGSSPPSSSPAPRSSRSSPFYRCMECIFTSIDND